jgi:hypothetical protein
VYKYMCDEAKYSQGKSMWEPRTWTAKGIAVYRSSWTWAI